MPELPEVEHARSTLERWSRGAIIRAASVRDERILDEGVSARRVVRALEGRRIAAIERRGKWLRITLDRGAVFSHLGMTGKWVRPANAEDEVRFEKVRLELTRSKDKGNAKTSRVVSYIDPRLFGRFVVVEEEGKDLPVWTELGPDPLVDGIDVAALHAKLARRRLAIKPTLLDQTVLAGVGNILATEALFAARIDPRRPARDLSRAEVSAIARGLRKSIARTLALATRGGDTIEYVEEPGAENPFVIYGREGTPCPRCKHPLGKMFLAGRGTVFCIHCQTSGS